MRPAIRVTRVRDLQTGDQLLAVVGGPDMPGLGLLPATILAVRRRAADPAGPVVLAVGTTTGCRYQLGTLAGCLEAHIAPRDGGGGPGISEDAGS